MATLVYSDVDGGERLLSLGADPVTVGRAPECAIRSDDPRVSRVHATFFIDHGTLWVEDMGSANGVYIGLNRIQKAPVPSGEVVLIGSLLIRLLSASGTLPPPNGVHGTLAAWLESERKARATVETERDAFGKRVNELYDEAKQLRDRLSERGVEMARLQTQLDELKHGGTSALPVASHEAGESPASSASGSETATHSEAAVDAGPTSTAIATDQLPLVAQLAAMKVRAEAAERDALAAQIRAQGVERTFASARDATVKAEAKTAEFERRVGEAEQQRARLETELAAQLEKTAALETRLGTESVDSAVQATEARAAKLAVELAEAKQQFETQRARAAELTALLAEAEKATKAADAREKTAQAQLADAHHQLQAASAGNARRLKAEEARVAELETRVRSLDGAEAALVAAQQARDDARDMVAGAEQKLAAAVARADASDDRATAAEVMAKTMAKDVAEALRRAADVEIKLRAATRELEAAQRRAEEVEQREAASAGSVRSLEERTIAAEIQRTQLQKELVEKVAALDAEHRTRTETAVKSVEAELERVQQQLAAQRALHETLIAERSALEGQVGTLQQRIRELESSAQVGTAALVSEDPSQSSVSALQSQLAAAKAAAKSAVKTAAALEKRIDATETELKASNDARAELAAELATLRDQPAEMHDQSIRIRELEATLAAAEQRAADQSARATDLEQRANAAADRALAAERRATELQENLEAMATKLAAPDAKNSNVTEDLEIELSEARARIAELTREVDAAENVRQFAATTEREIAQLARELREQKQAVTTLTLERDRLVGQLSDLQSDSETIDRRATSTEPPTQADLSRYTALVARAAELEAQVVRMETDHAGLKRDLAQANARLAAQQRDRDDETTNVASAPTAEVAEWFIVLEESIDSLRANMRAASDETAVMEQNESVVVVSAAVSHAAEHIDRARSALRALSKLLPTS